MKSLTQPDLVVGVTYNIDFDGSKGYEPWKGQAIYRGVDVFTGYAPGALCFECLSPITGQPNGTEGVFDIEHVVGLASQDVIDLRKALAAIVNARDRAMLADDPAYIMIDRAIDDARKFVGRDDESS